MTLSFARWAALMGLHPWHAHQLADSTVVPVTSACNSLIYERATLNADRVGRTEIRQAIIEAERLIHAHGGYWPTPRDCEVTLTYPRLGDHRLSRLWDVQADGRWVSVMVPDRLVLGLGPPVETDVQTASLTYADLDADGLAETATATATVAAGTLDAEIVARFVAGDCGPIVPAPDIPLRRVVVSGTTATLTFDAYTLVRPALTAGYLTQTLNPTILPPMSGTPFAASIQVVRRRPDPGGTTTNTAMAVLAWEDRPAPIWLPACCGGGTDPAGLTTAIARATLRDAGAGIVAIGEAIYDSDSGTWSAACDWRCAPPDRVTIRYRAGIDDGSYDTVVARLAAAVLARPVCACDSANREIYLWQQDLSRTGATNELFAPPATISNPLGTRRGHVYAWSQIVRDQRLAGIAAG